MKKFMISALFILFALDASAAVKREFQDIKLPTQVVLERQYFTTPVAADDDRVAIDTAGGTSAAVATLSSFAAQPDVPRNITITPGGTTTDVEACVIVVSGTNIRNASISENFTFLANATDPVVGGKAFKTVSSVVFPASCESGGFAATWDIGVGEKIGLKSCMDLAGDWVSSQVAGVYETTRATIAASATVIESNTADFNGTMDGSAAFIGYFIQNFRCN